jgi:hypothetical protein
MTEAERQRKWNALMARGTEEAKRSENGANDRQNRWAVRRRQILAEREAIKAKARAAGEPEPTYELDPPKVAPWHFERREGVVTTTKVAFKPLTDHVEDENGYYVAPRPGSFAFIEDEASEFMEDPMNPHVNPVGQVRPETLAPAEPTPEQVFAQQAAQAEYAAGKAERDETFGRVESRVGRALRRLSELEDNDGK